MLMTLLQMEKRGDFEETPEQNPEETSEPENPFFP